MSRHMDDREVITDSQHGFKKGRSYLDNLVASYHGVTALVDKGRVTDIISLGFCKDFDMISHNIPVSKVERCRIDGWTFQWVSNWLDGWIQSCS